MYICMYMYMCMFICYLCCSRLPGSVLYRGDILTATVLYRAPCDVPDIAILSVDVSCRPSDVLDLDRCLDVNKVHEVIIM